MRATFSRRLGRELAARFTYDGAFYFALGAAGFAAAVHIVWFVTISIAFRHRLDAATMVIIDWDTSILMMHIRIGLALLIGVIGLWSRRCLGLFLSLLAFAWITLEYVGWYVWSLRIKSNADIEDFPPPTAHALDLYGATPWNAVVLVLVIAVLLWEIVQLIKIAKSQPIQTMDRGKIGR